MMLVAGWYGKMPSLGDFAHRRLSLGFISTWDAWLQSSLAASRSRLGDNWLETYLTSPIWRFALMPGVCGENAWTGLLMPSVDKVGRHFPLTLALELALHPPLDPLSAILDAEAWHQGLEKIALSALDIEFSPDDFERHLALHPFPAAPTPHAAQVRAVTQLARWWQDTAASPVCFDVPGDVLVVNIIKSAAKQSFAATARGKSLWWLQASGEDAPAELHCCSGLPPEPYFSILLQGTQRCAARQ